ncbi:4'-phosphopantetheinyl transferase superfamily protein [Flavobacterium sp. LC2016-23]|uniref:4'-phosphopantetheinyl transferase family protein n=1 Tax=Flavobacterium sp. LC2016-23 TaxID=2666330 RepID=UPI0012B061DA|nr:4'-phosphopantetheinyl transferase superfamily protein [Flavobacterium sp. LC2016-23]MRX41219.1 4'-phosphopantetheinyl transferase superfamily protein [Flavobacterium sp. LC2016-23]
MRVYYAIVPRPLNDFDFKKYLKQMPSAIQLKIGRYKNWQDAHTSLIGKLLLTQALQDSGLQKMDLSVLTYNKYGRPSVPGIMDFNISHSENLVVCAIATNGSIGIDAEALKPINKTDFYNCWTPAEAKIIYQDPEDYKTFYSHWTKKEAVVKAIGNGLNIPLTDIEIKGDLATVAHHGNWYVKEIPLSEKYIVHMAAKEPYKDPVVVIQKEF